MVESCLPSGCRACSVRHARVRCLVALCCHPLLRCHSTLRWYFFVCQQLCFKVHTHTQKNTRGQRMRQKIASRASSVFASSSRQGTAVERARAAACMQAKFGCGESANEQSCRAQGLCSSQSPPLKKYSKTRKLAAKF